LTSAPLSRNSNLNQIPKLSGRVRGWCALRSAKMKVALITLNLLLSFYMFVFAIPMTSYTQDINTASMAKSLYADGAINEDQLEKMHPIPLEQYGYRKLQGTIDRMMGYPAMIGFMLNALLIGIFMDRKSKAEQGAEN
jgi:uncharacterized membrane protein YeiB